MGKILQLAPRPDSLRSRDLERTLRVLLHKARSGELRGIAFVALKTAGCCAGVVGVPEEGEALSTAYRLIDAIRGEGDYLEPIEGPGPIRPAV